MRLSALNDDRCPSGFVLPAGRPRSPERENLPCAELLEEQVNATATLIDGLGTDLSKLPTPVLEDIGHQVVIPTLMQDSCEWHGGNEALSPIGPAHVVELDDKRTEERAVKVVHRILVCPAPLPQPRPRERLEHHCETSRRLERYFEPLRGVPRSRDSIESHTTPASFEQQDMSSIWRRCHGANVLNEPRFHIVARVDVIAAHRCLLSHAATFLIPKVLQRGAEPSTLVTNTLAPGAADLIRSRRAVGVSAVFTNHVDPSARTDGLDAVEASCLSRASRFREELGRSKLTW